METRSMKGRSERSEHSLESLRTGRGRVSTKGPPRVECVSVL